MIATTGELESGREPPKDLINLTAAGRLLGVRRTVVERWVKKGKLDSWTLAGEKVLVSAAEVRALLQPGYIRPRDRVEAPAPLEQPARRKRREGLFARMRRERTERELRKAGLPVPPRPG